MRSSDLIKKLADLIPLGQVYIDTPHGTYNIAAMERVGHIAFLVSECVPIEESGFHDSCSLPCPRAVELGELPQIP